jgi:hypothetical protein
MTRPFDCKRNSILGLGLVVLAAVGLRAWRDRGWAGTFNSDEAVIGLMARHVLQGELPVYYWGENYIGSVGAFLALPFLAALGWTVPALRAGTLLVVAGVLVLHATLVRRHAGAVAAVGSLGLLAAPAIPLLDYTTAPEPGTFGLVVLVGTAIFALAHSEDGGIRRAAAVGLLVGFGAWIKQTTLLYVLAAASVWLLRSPEWAALRRRLPWPGGMWAVVPPVLAGLALAALFTNGCAQPSWLETARVAARLALLGLGAGALAGLLAVSDHRGLVARVASAFGVGAVAGYAPALVGWWVLGQVPKSGAAPSCPSGLVARLGLVVQVFLPTIAGDGGAMDGASLLRPEALAALAAAALALLSFAWHERRMLLSLATLADDRRTNPVVQGFLVLLLLNLAAAVATGSTVDFASVRHLFPAWQAYTVVAGVGLAALWRSARPVFVAGAGLLVAAVVPNVAAALGTQTSGPWSPPAIQALERHLVARGAATGFADYWTAYAVDFLTDERLRLTTFHGARRYLGYDAAQAGSLLTAYVFEPGQLPDGVDVLGAARDRLRGVVRTDVLERTARQVVVDRARVDRWDVVVSSEGGRVDRRFLAAVTHPASESFGGILALDGYTVQTDDTNGELIVRLFWRAESRSEIDYSAAVNLVDDQGRIVDQQDQVPGEAVGNPPHLWSVGDIVVDPHRMRRSRGGQSDYRLQVGLYDSQTGRPLVVRGPDGAERTALLLAWLDG